jgi:hypothetical protein
MPNSLLQAVVEGIFQAFFHDIVDWMAHTRAGRICAYAILAAVLGLGVYGIGKLAGWW